MLPPRITWLGLMIVLILSRNALVQSKEPAMARHTSYRTVKVDGLSIVDRTNVAAYPKWQAWLQKSQPRLLVLWGKHDPSFDVGESKRYLKDVPTAEVHVLDAGHFALDTKAQEIAALVSEFMTKQK